MFVKYFESRQRMNELAVSPGSCLLEGFRLKLCEAGYAEITARRHLRAAEHLLYWAHKNRISSTALSLDVITRFGNHLKRCTSLGNLNSPLAAGVA